MLFQRLTGQHVAVSNYPGTTVELARGAARRLPETVILDTPGVITFPPHSEDEQVTARVLLYEPLRAILQVGDAKNLRRTLLLNVHLAELGLPLVLALNMMDEAENRGVQADLGLLSQNLSLPVVPTTATRGRGLDELQSALVLPACGVSLIETMRLPHQQQKGWRFMKQLMVTMMAIAAVVAANSVRARQPTQDPTK